MSTPTAPVTETSNGGTGEGYPSQCGSSKQNEGANTLAPQTYMLPTDTTVVGDVLNANDHYANHLNQFELHTPDTYRSYAAGMLLRTPGTHEHFASSMFLGELSTININSSNIHT